MPILVKMGAISPTMSSGQIVEWKVKVGDTVKEGDMIAEVQTDKAVMPLESFDEGVVAKLLVEAGQEVPVGHDVLLLAGKGEDARALAAGSSNGSAPAKSATAATPASSNGHEATPGATPARAWVEPVSHAIAIDAPIGTNGGHGHDHGHAEGGRVKSSPLARKVAAVEKVDLAQVRGSGPGGRVVRADVDSFLKNRGSAPLPAAASAKPATAALSRPVVGDEVVKLSRMQTTIAARMTEAKRVAPEIHVTVDIRIDTLVKLRETLNNVLAKEKIKLSVGDFVTKAVAVALRRHPAVNATFDGETLTRRGEVNVGIAVALPEGLIVPVLKNADSLGLREIRLGSEALYDSARSMKLTADQMGGGTFTISNLGMYGVKTFDAILNLPQVGILAVGAAEKRPVVEGNALVVGTVLSVTLTADHRVVNGADAAEFLRTLKGLLEEPASMLL